MSGHQWYELAATPHGAYPLYYEHNHTMVLAVQCAATILQALINITALSSVGNRSISWQISHASASCVPLWQSGQSSSHGLVTKATDSHQAASVKFMTYISHWWWTGVGKMAAVLRKCPTLHCFDTWLGDRKGIQPVKTRATYPQRLSLSTSGTREPGTS